MIALLCSVPLEAELILANITSSEMVSLGSKTIHRGLLYGKETVLCAGGLGKTNAAHAATLLITRFDPKALIIFGVGGAYPSSGAGIGDIVLASEEVYGDEGVLTAEGFRPADFIGIPLAKMGQVEFYNHIPADDYLLTLAGDILSSSYPDRDNHASGPRLMTGRFVTLSTTTGTDQRAAEIEKMYQPLCENMEGAAAAHVAVMHNIPWLEVRGISNIVENRDTSKWDISGAAAEAQKAVLKIVSGFSAM